jgi:predicted nucleotidyltransferase
MNTVQLDQRDLDILQRVLRAFPCVREARIFGSRANGTAGRASDIDLAIDAPDATIDHWLEIKEAIQSAPIIYEFDIIRMDCLNNPSLIEKIDRQGVTIYSNPYQVSSDHQA